MEQKGPALSCLAHFFNEKWPNITKEAKGYIKVYFGLQFESDLLGYLAKNIPKGLVLIKVIYLLKRYGYVAEEIESAPEPILDIIEILARSEQKVNQVAEKVGYKENDTLYRVLFGRRKCSPKVLLAMSELAHERKGFSGKLSLPEVENETAVEKNPIATDDLARLAGLIVVLSKTYQILEPWLLDLIKNSTVEERLTLRTILEAGGTGIFPVSSQAYRVSAQLTAITSEKALNEFNAKNGRNR